MNKATADRLMAIYERVGNLLNEADAVVSAIENEDEQKELRRPLGELMASLWLRLEAPIVRTYPDLDPDREIPEPDPPLSSEQQARVRRLSATEIEEIDQALLEDACDQWRKVARIVGTALGKVRGRIPGVPDLFYAQRVRHLVAIGRLESQGNLAFMRFSEVRLPRTQGE
jgi:chaperonin cofactor prefoldin